MLVKRVTSIEPLMIAVAVVAPTGVEVCWCVQGLFKNAINVRCTDSSIVDVPLLLTNGPDIVGSNQSVFVIPGSRTAA